MAVSNASQLQRTLESVTLFADLMPATRARVAASCTWRSYKAGEPILNYLEASDEVFFITDGGARVIAYSPAGKIVSFRDLGPGDTFGEIPAIDGGPRSASVEATTESTRCRHARCRLSTTLSKANPSSPRRCCASRSGRSGD